MDSDETPPNVHSLVAYAYRAFALPEAEFEANKFIISVCKGLLDIVKNIIAVGGLGYIYIKTGYSWPIRIIYYISFAALTAHVGFLLQSFKFRALNPLYNSYPHLESLDIAFERLLQIGLLIGTMAGLIIAVDQLSKLSH